MDWHVTTNDLGNARPYGNPHVTWFTNKAQITGILPISVNDSRKTFVRLAPTRNIFSVQTISFPYRIFTGYSLHLGHGFTFILHLNIMRFIVDVLLTGLAVFLAAYLLPSSAVSVGGFGWAILAGLIIAFVNATIGTVLRVFTLPLNILTLGLVSFIISVLMVQLTSYFMGSKFDVANFWWAAVFAIIVAIIQLILDSLFGRNKV